MARIIQGLPPSEGPGGNAGVPNAPNFAGGGARITVGTVRGPGETPGVGVDAGAFINPITQAANATAKMFGALSATADTAYRALEENKSREESAEIAFDLEMLSEDFEEYLKTLPADPAGWDSEWQNGRGKDLYDEYLAEAKGKYRPGTFKIVEQKLRHNHALQVRNLQERQASRGQELAGTKINYAYNKRIEAKDFDGAIGLIRANTGKWFAPEEAEMEVQKVEKLRENFEQEEFVKANPLAAEELIKSVESGASTIRGNFTDVSADSLTPHLGDGLKPYAADFVEAGNQYGLDPRFLAAVAKVETGNGTSSAFRNKNNAMGISDAKGPVALGSVRDSIFQQAASLAREGGYYDGKNTIEEIGAVYAPPGAGNDPNKTNHTWPAQVRQAYAAMGGRGDSARAAHLRKVRDTAIEFNRAEEIQAITSQIESGEFVMDDQYFEMAMDSMAYLTDEDRQDLTDIYHGQPLGMTQVMQISGALDQLVNQPSIEEADKFRAMAAISKAPAWARSYLSAKLDRGGEGELGEQASRLQKRGEAEIDTVISVGFGPSLGVDDAVTKVRAEWAAKEALYLWLKRNPEATDQDMNTELEAIRQEIRSASGAKHLIDRVWPPKNEADAGGSREYILKLHPMTPTTPGTAVMGVMGMGASKGLETMLTPAKDKPQSTPVITNYGF